MWLFLSAIVLCVFLFSMALLWVRVQDVRADAIIKQVEADRAYDKYKRVTRQEAIGDLTAVLEKLQKGQLSLPKGRGVEEQALYSYDDLGRPVIPVPKGSVDEHWNRILPVARYMNPKEPPMLNDEWVEYEKTRQHNAWMQRQRQRYDGYKKSERIWGE